MKKLCQPACTAVIVLLSAGALTSCIDDNYDLSDIDTTTELKVNDLTIPVNFKDITLENIIDLDDSDPDAILKIRNINGVDMYYFSKGGSFTADPKSIDKIQAPTPDNIENTSVQINMVGNAGMRASSAAEYTITPFGRTFAYHIGSNGNPAVDPAIKVVKDVTLDASQALELTLTFSSEAIKQQASSIEIYDLVLNVPEGFTACYGSTYAQNGKLTIPEIHSTTGNASIKLTVSKIDFATAESPNGIAVKNGAFEFEEYVGVESGRFIVYPNNTSTALPATIDFNTSYDLTSFTVSLFSGTFDYELDFDAIAPFDFNDLPDFLSGDETDITLINPALTLAVNNPVATYGLECTTGLTLTAERNSGAAQSSVLSSFNVGNNSVNQFHILAPSQSAEEFVTVPAGMTPQYTAYPSLGELLSGKGLPNRVTVDFASPANPKPRVLGNAIDFPLGRNLDQVNGEYNFCSPLALADKSVIVYTSTEDGWNDEDVDAIAISKLSISAVATSTIPAGAKIYIRPIDVNGNRIPLTNAETAFITLPALAKDSPVSIELLGNITHLDGIYIEAIVNDFNGEILTPDQTIQLTEVRAKVTGTYTKEL